MNSRTTLSAGRQTIEGIAETIGDKEQREVKIPSSDKRRQPVPPASIPVEDSTNAPEVLVPIAGATQVPMASTSRGARSAAGDGFIEEADERRQCGHPQELTAGRRR